MQSQFTYVSFALVSTYITYTLKQEVELTDSYSYKQEKLMLYKLSIEFELNYYTFNDHEHLPHHTNILLLEYIL